ncbi:hypothetical protein A8F94_09665 [Bacillus sp. FJAT-27225]|uniref:hypothetical protein n=1 Tax=Bacillus sp. FJAT-27225 TaxID=1743144 RepID=UPI00080C3392|nr:hypothetical protein [Bacillus sp. FJAT-27225]OCA88076.1 hypothetical protein A8F94_09665 [Bacillus sp. FJAT-27225]
MDRVLQKYIDDYSGRQEKRNRAEDEQRSINNPVIFMFIGDQAGWALEATAKINDVNWHNSPGVAYFHAYQTSPANYRETVSVKMPGAPEDKRNARQEVYQAFHHDEAVLIELNRSFRMLANKVAEQGRLYTSLQKVTISVVTHIDDPLNALVPELTLLFRSILNDSFKMVEVDFLGLIKEKYEGDDFATSLGISFLKELDYYQSGNFSFEKDIQLAAGDLRLPVKHQHGFPLFNLAYLLSDKDENGRILPEANWKNCEIISYINLLKNRKIIAEYDEHMDSYNNEQFRKAVQGNEHTPAYTSAAFSKVKRPNRTIALHAAWHFFKIASDSFRQAASQPQERILKLFGLDEEHLNRLVAEVMPGREILADMESILIQLPGSYSAIKRLTVLDAEEEIAGEAARRFFTANVETPLRDTLAEKDFAARLNARIDSSIVDNNSYGLYCAYSWTSEENEEGALRAVRKLISSTRRQAEEAGYRVSELYMQTVDMSDFKKIHLPFSDKKNIRNFIEYLYSAIYGAKLAEAALNARLEILTQYEEALIGKNRQLARTMALLNEAGQILSEAANDSLHEADQYLGKNVPEYYETVVGAVVKRLKERRGTSFLAQERFFGKLEEGLEAFMARLLAICSDEILTEDEFHRGFEDELLERANAKTEYGNRDILSKEDLFKELYRRLLSQSSVQIELQSMTPHQYEEKYFFGDFYSNFVKYAVGKESDLRQYKVGCIHQKKSSGIAKLSLLGGFRSSDLMYWRNNMKYYDGYRKMGFGLHPDYLAETVAKEGENQTATEA